MGFILRRFSFYLVAFLVAATINFLLPGSFDTRRLQSSLSNAAAKRGTDAETIGAEKRQAIPAKRFGDPAEFGAACAFLCSTHAGYITGQSLLIDGGAFILGLKAL